MAPPPRNHQAPYLSVVVTSRNDDHGGDPLKRLQAFVNCFDAQCRRTGLDAEIIIVEWNPPEDKPRLQTLVKWPSPCVCTYRFITVPPELHGTLEYSDVLPLFQMIAKNVGIRRARGRFVLVTNIDIVFSNELVEYLASGRLEPGLLYRVDRHDIQPDLPVHAPLDEQIAYCETHRLRIHTRWGSYAVDGLGRALPMAEDIVDGKTVRLGAGWHVREGVAATGFCRWATDRAQVHINGSSDPTLAAAVLEIEAQSNPYTPSSWVDLEIADESGAILARHRVTRRRILRLPLHGDTSPRTLELRVMAVPQDSRRDLAVFERRGSMHYQVRSIRFARLDEATAQPVFVYPSAYWRELADAAVDFGPLETVAVTTAPHRSAHTVEYGPLRAPYTGTCRFTMTYDVEEGNIAIGALDKTSREWLPAVVDYVITPLGHVATLRLDLTVGVAFSLMVANDHVGGDHSSRFVIKALTGSIEPTRVLAVGRREARAAMRMVSPEPLEASNDGPSRPQESFASQPLTFPMDGWRSANLAEPPELERVSDGLAVTSRGARPLYCVEHGPFRAPVTGRYRFALRYRLLEGGFLAGLLSGDRARWLPSSSREDVEDDRRTRVVTSVLEAGQTCWLTLSNDRPAGGRTKFVILELNGSVKRHDGLSSASVAESRVRTALQWFRRRTISVLLRIRARIVPGRLRSFIDRMRARIVHRSPEYGALLTVRQGLESELRRISELGELTHLQRLLHDQRPDDLHLNACGDFQLMAREHWFALLGYPEFQMFSMNIDGLFSSIAYYAGIRERALESPCHIYHLEHEKGSGWTPEGDELLRRRIAERGITWLDARDVFVWSTYMHWLRRPMIFNMSGWGFGDVELEESIVEPGLIGPHRQIS